MKKRQMTKKKGRKKVFDLFMSVLEMIWHLFAAK